MSRYKCVSNIINLFYSNLMDQCKVCNRWSLSLSAWPNPTTMEHLQGKKSCTATLMRQEWKRSPYSYSLCLTLYATVLFCIVVYPYASGVIHHTRLDRQSVRFLHSFLWCEDESRIERTTLIFCPHLSSVVGERAREQEKGKWICSVNAADVWSKK